MGQDHDGLRDQFAKTLRKNDTVWMIVDRLTKSAHLNLVNLELFPYLEGIIHCFPLKNHVIFTLDDIPCLAIKC